MVYLQYRPAPPLGTLVQKLWCCQGYQPAHRRERVLPTGALQIVIELARAAPALVSGIQSKHRVIDTAAQQSVAGVVFSPGGSRAFFDGPADAFSNRNVPLDLVWGSAAGELRERLEEAATASATLRMLEEALLRRLQEPFTPHRAVRFAVAAFQGRPHGQRVLDVTRDLGLSRRRFAQLFREEVGLTPKLYCRILRFNRALRRMGMGQEVDFAEVALACGYWDQAHFAHEFREFSGLSPGSFVTHERRWVNHVPVD